MPRVRGGVEFEAVEGQARPVLDDKVHLDVGVLAVALPAGDADALRRGDGWQHGVYALDDGEGLDNLLVGLGDLGYDKEGGGRSRQE